MARDFSSVPDLPATTLSDSFLMSSSTRTSLSAFRKTENDSGSSFPSVLRASRSVRISRRVHSNFITISADAPGWSISTYAILLPYLGSVATVASFENERFLIDWTVESWGTGSQTRSFLVPAGTSGTLPTYSIENVRLSAGFRYFLSATCWAAPSWQHASFLAPFASAEQHASPAFAEPPASQPAEPAARARTATMDRFFIMGLPSFGLTI